MPGKRTAKMGFNVPPSDGSRDCERPGSSVLGELMDDYFIGSAEKMA